METDLFRPQEAAEYLTVTERHLRDLWDRREIKGTKIGRLLRFHREDLDAYIAQCREAS